MGLVETSKEDYLVAWFTALAITIHVLESQLPTPLPGVKPGLANIVTVLVLCQYGLRLAIWVAVLRVLIGSLIIGTFLSPTFVLSLSGVVGSLMVLSIANWISRLCPTWALGPIGYSVVAAIAHMSCQFFIAYVVFVPHRALFSLFPVFITAAIVFGLLSGVVAQSVLREQPGVRH